MFEASLQVADPKWHLVAEREHTATGRADRSKRHSGRFGSHGNGARVLGGDDVTGLILAEPEGMIGNAGWRFEHSADV